MVSNRAEPGKDADAPVLEVADEPPGPLPGLIGHILLLRVGQPLGRQVQEQPRLVPLDQDLEGRVYLLARTGLELGARGLRRPMARAALAKAQSRPRGEFPNLHGSTAANLTRTPVLGCGTI